MLSVIGGWHAVARRFFSTVGRRGLTLSVFFPFRFMHPPLVIPWSAVERCEEVRFWLTGFGPRRLLFSGALGRAILAAWTAAPRGS